MKKKFESPTMDIIKIKKQNLLAGSPKLGGDLGEYDAILGRELDWEPEDLLNMGF